MTRMLLALILACHGLAFAADGLEAFRGSLNARLEVIQKRIDLLETGSVAGVGGVGGIGVAVVNGLMVEFYGASQLNNQASMIQSVLLSEDEEVVKRTAFLFNYQVVNEHRYALQLLRLGHGDFDEDVRAKAMDYCSSFLATNDPDFKARLEE